MLTFILSVFALFGLGTLVVFLFGVGVQKGMDKDRRQPSKKDDKANAKYRDGM